MSSSILSAKYFHDEAAAYKWVESRVWPHGPTCPHCKGTDRVGALQGSSTRPGVYKCYACRKPFTVKIGTIFEDSHVKLNLWLQAIYLVASSKKGISAHQLHRTLGVTLKTAWFMGHRIRLAMGDSGPTSPMGEGGGTIEADETYIGKVEGSMTRKDMRAAYKAGERVEKPKKAVVFALLERGGKVRSRHISGPLFNQIKAELAKASPDAHLMTDSAKMYNNIGKQFASHETVNHYGKEYARGHVTTNTIEGYFSVFKRGMTGVYQHCRERHLHRYLAEFDFRYNNRSALQIEDAERADVLLRGITGKRLMYKTPDQPARD